MIQDLIEEQLSKLNTSTSKSAITEELCDCRVGQIWPKVEEDILQPLQVYLQHCDVTGLQSYQIR